MNGVAAAAERLADAVRTVEGLRYYPDLSATVDPPAVLVGPPRLRFESMCVEPTTATFVVFVMAAMDERALPRLWELVPRVSAAVDELLPEAAVSTADPGVFNSGGTDLPSYEITVEVSLT